MSRTRAPYEPNKNVLDYSSAVEYVKNVLDSKSPPYKGGYETDGHALLAARYSNLKDEVQKKLIAQAIVELLDDPDYSFDAIPVAAECGILEAKEWFVNFSNKPVEEMRQVKTNGYSNGLSCFIIYASRDNTLINVLKNFISKNILLPNELFITLFNISENDPDFILNNIEEYFNKLIPTRDKESDKLSDIAFMLSGVFKKYGDNYCINLAKRFKEKLPKEYQTLFYKALKSNGKQKFHSYLEDLKNILDITE